MGSGVSRLLSPACLKAAPEHPDVIFPSELDETLGHSFCYIRSSSPFLSPSQSSRFSPSHSSRFKSISGASVSANTSTSRTVIHHEHNHNAAESNTISKLFESSASFDVIPLQPLPPSAAANGADIAPIDRTFFMSGPIERGALSGPLDVDNSAAGIHFSAPLGAPRNKRKKSFPRKSFRRSFSVVPVLNFIGGRKENFEEKRKAEVAENLHWAHGKAGEDRVHVVISDDQRWLFVGIYDGFNGPDAPEFLMSNLYCAVFNELNGLLWDERTAKRPPLELSRTDGNLAKKVAFQSDQIELNKRITLRQLLAEASSEDGGLDISRWNGFMFSIKCASRPAKKKSVSCGQSKVQRQDTMDDRERLGQSFRKFRTDPVDHEFVLSALSRALKITERAYLDMTDKVLDQNPELALMGSCLLVMLMKDDDVYVMNVGDSRAIVAQYKHDNSSLIPHSGDNLLDEGIVETVEGAQQAVKSTALQLSTDHSTSIEEEVLRIKAEHPDDCQCIVNDRVKGRLKVTRAFGAGFLKEPKWNNAVLEMFRNDYIGTAPYISCSPSLCHHKLGPSDQFLILSSDGLYQYFTNEEAVTWVESFMEKYPDGDPAQHLIEELLSRAATKAGMDFHELLDIPQGDRRKYHDDVTVMVISLEGRIWKSSGKYL